jgi:tRNA 2-thiocytidine biosynthesis protein TtcA
MPPTLRSDDRKNMVIRPLAYCKEKDIAKFSAEKQFPIIPCNLCGSQPNLKRARVKKLLEELEKEIPHVRASILTALSSVTPSHLLDTDLYDFKNFQTLLKQARPLHGNVEEELDAVFNHSEESLKMPSLMQLV